MALAHIPTPHLFSTGECSMDSTKIQQKIFEWFSNHDEFKNYAKRYAVSQDVMMAALKVDTTKIYGNEYFFRNFSNSQFCVQATDNLFFFILVKYDEIRRATLIVGYNVNFSHPGGRVEYDCGVGVRIKEDRFEMRIGIPEGTSSLPDNEGTSRMYAWLTAAICLLLHEKTQVTRSAKSHKLFGVGKHRIPMDVQYIGIKVPRVEAVYKSPSGANDNTSGIKLDDRPAWDVIGSWHTHRTKGGRAEYVHSWMGRGV